MELDEQRRQDNAVSQLVQERNEPKASTFSRKLSMGVDLGVNFRRSVQAFEESS